MTERNKIIFKLAAENFTTNKKILKFTGKKFWCSYLIGGKYKFTAVYRTSSIQQTPIVKYIEMSVDIKALTMLHFEKNCVTITKNGNGLDSYRLSLLAFEFTLKPTNSDSKPEHRVSNLLFLFHFD